MQSSHELHAMNVCGIPVPCASPKLLWRTKQTYRDKDGLDRQFLRVLLKEKLPSAG